MYMRIFSLVLFKNSIIHTLFKLIIILLIYKMTQCGGKNDNANRIKIMNHLYTILL